MRAAALLAAALCAGCSTLATKEVSVPVPVPCVKDLPARPPLVSNAELAAMDDYQLPLALFRDRLVREDYMTEIEATLTACKG